MLRCCSAKMAALLRKPPLTFQPNTALLPKPNFTPISSCFNQKSLSKIRFPCHSHQLLPNFSPRHVIFRFGRKGLGFDSILFRAVSDGGSGGDGGFGGLGDGSSGGGGGGDESEGKDSFFFSWYLRALDKHPVATKSITSAFLTLIGDLICQLLIDQVPILDLKRTFVFTLLGLVLVGPTLHFWYLSLSKLVTLPGASGAFLRLLLDQFVFAPIFIGVFLCSLVTLEGRPSQVMPTLQQEWFSSVLANWQLWIPFQFLNFQFVPQKFQVLAANVVALAWNVILSFKAHKEVVVK